MLETVYSVATAGLGFAAIAAMVWLAARPGHERESEAAARTYFDQHGRWPDDDR